LNYCGFRGVGGRNDEIWNFLFASEDSDGKHAGYGTNAAIEAEFADEKEAIDIVNAKSAVGSEDSDSDGEVEAGALFFEIGWSEIDGGDGGRDEIAGVFDGGADAVAALANGCVGKSDGVKDVLIGDYAAVINFYVN
jgi:hypothetical protein